MILLTAILQNDTLKVLVLNNPKTFFDYIKEPNTMIAITAIVISVVGFIYSVRYNRKSLKQSEEYNRKTLEQTIKHNKLSVINRQFNIGISTTADCYQSAVQYTHNPLSFGNSI